MRRSICVVVICAMTSIAASCPFTGGVDRAVEAIDRAITQLHADSTRWQAVLNDLAGQLRGTIDHTIEVDLVDFVARSSAIVGQQFTCRTDVLSQRVERYLIRLKAALLHRHAPPPTYPPTFCAVTDTIDLSAPATDRKVVTANGADFDSKDDAGRPVAFVFFSDTTQHLFPFDEGRVGRNTHYNLTLDVSGDEVTQFITTNKITKILFMWNGANKDMPQVLVLRQIAQVRQEGPIALGPVDFNPRHINGDAGFDINNDNPMETEVAGKLFIDPDKQHVMLNVYMHGRERQPDHTEVEGWKSEVQTGTRVIEIPLLTQRLRVTVPVFGEGHGQVAYTAPDGWRIKSVRPLGETRATANITSHDMRGFDQAAGEVVKRFEITGSSGGGEAGTTTGVRTIFNDITVVIEQAIR
jgi:hypothetical protein